MKKILSIMMSAVLFASVLIPNAFANESAGAAYQGIFMKGDIFIELVLYTDTPPSTTDGIPIGMAYQISSPTRDSHGYISSENIKTLGEIYFFEGREDCYCIIGTDIFLPLFYIDKGIILNDDDLISEVHSGNSLYEGKYVQVSNAGANMSPDMIWLNVPPKQIKQVKGINGNIYTLYQGEKTWDEAKTFCETMGDHLITINDREELELCKQIIPENADFWTGMKITDRLATGKSDLYWITGEGIDRSLFTIEFGDSSYAATSIEATNMDDIGIYLTNRLYYKTTEYFICETENKEEKDETTNSVSYESDVHKFARVSGNENVTFAVENFLEGYNDKVNIIEPCPVRALTLCVYNNYIYYLEGGMQGDEDSYKIYRCDLDGSNKLLIADNASNYGEAYIVDGVLYYTVCELDVYNKINGGIFKINLNDLSWGRVVTDLYAELICCDANYLYYKVGQNFYRIDNDGSCCYFMNENDIEISMEYYKDGGGYFSDAGGVYACNWDRSKIEKLCSMPKSTEFTYVYNKTGGYVYYSFYSGNYLYLYRVHVDGGESEYISRRMAAGGGLY